MYHRSPLLLDPNHSQLLVVDLQERLLPAMTEGSRIAFNARRLLNAAGLFQVPVVVSEQYPKGLGPTVPEVSAAIPADSVVLPKKSFSVCADEALGAALAASAAPVVLCGVEAHVCVLQTALDLSSQGRDVFLVVDAVGSRFPEDGAAALRRLESAGITLTSTESVLFEWCRSADSGHFKAVSALAKEQQVLPG